jgi:hypothetical protein
MLRRPLIIGVPAWSLIGTLMIYTITQERQLFVMIPMTTFYIVLEL